MIKEQCKKCKFLLFTMGGYYCCVSSAYVGGDRCRFFEYKK